MKHFATKCFAAMTLLALGVVLLPSVACSGRDGPIKSFTAERNTVTKGGTTKLTAVFDSGTGTIDNEIGDVTSGVAVTTPELKEKTRFTLTVVNDLGSTFTKSIEIDAIDPAVITSFKPDKVIRPGESTNITAVFSGGTGVVDHGIGPVKSGVPVSTGKVDATKIYTLTVTNDAGDDVKATAEVEAAVTPVITSFSAPGPVVSRLAPMELTAVFTGGKGTVDHDVGPIVSNTPTKTPPVPFAGGTYTLTVTNGLGEKTSKTLSVTTKKEMFVADYDGDVLVFDADASGDVAPKRRIQLHEGKNANAAADGLLGLLVTSDSIFLANENGTPAIRVFGIADFNDAVPKQKISGGAGWIAEQTGPFMMSLSGTDLFVPDKSSSIKIWNTTDTGSVAPKRTIQGQNPATDQFMGTWVDNGELYVSNLASLAEGEQTILVYAATASGTATPKRTFKLTAPADTPSGLVISGNDLFVCSQKAVTVYDKNTGTKLRQITGDATTIDVQACQCAIDAGELYCAIDYKDEVIVFPTTADGNVAPKRVIKGPNSNILNDATVAIF